ncbi:MAG: 30S ribosomal protein S9 [bacterium]|nr:30S ribosomal protein S9 [bacterium]
MEGNHYYGTGRRKRAIARVRLVAGTGKMMVNNLDIAEYLGGLINTQLSVVQQPLIATSTIGKYDVLVRVGGGGKIGQVGAIRHGIARALLESNLELKPVLRKGGFLTRDPREHERKKYGLYGRRRRFQYSKR